MCNDWYSSAARRCAQRLHAELNSGMQRMSAEAMSTGCQHCKSAATPWWRRGSALLLHRSCASSMAGRMASEVIWANFAGLYALPADGLPMVALRLVPNRDGLNMHRSMLALMRQITAPVCNQGKYHAR